MRWQGRRRSENVEDVRGRGGGRRVAVGGGGLLVVLVVASLMGVDPSILMSVLDQTQVATAPQGEPTAPPADDPQAEMVSVVLGDTEEVWGEIFAKADQRYAEPRLVLFRDTVQSACGFASAAVGPFYCPADQRVYLDLSFFEDLDRRFGAPGDFAQAYVVAHEVGHHVQKLLGTSDLVHQKQQEVGQEAANALSVRLELQADCYAGVWGHHAGGTRALLEEGDVEEGLRAAAAIGDDRLQRQSQGYVVPESFTHGSSEERQHWLRRGLESGDPNDCNAFKGRS
jgi:predicted metalloprotease